MKLDYIDPECEEEQQGSIHGVSSFVAGKAYNALCAMMAGEGYRRFPDCRVQEAAPFLHEFFMELMKPPPSSKEADDGRPRCPGFNTLVRQHEAIEALLPASRAALEAMRYFRPTCRLKEADQLEAAIKQAEEAMKE